MAKQFHPSTTRASNFKPCPRSFAFARQRARHVRLYSVDGKNRECVSGVHYGADAVAGLGPGSNCGSCQAVSYFSENSPMQEQDLLADTNAATAPLHVFVEVPLRTDDNQHLAGVIQFLMDGSGIAGQYAELDRNLAVKFSAAFIVAAGILITGLWLAMRRVQRANQQLAQRTQNLLQANRELALAARTSAVGAVASHLIHGLKNPLSGLSNFVHAQTEASLSGSDTEWRTALSTTQRMEELINRVVRVLQEQQSGVAYEISIGELMEMLCPKERKPTADVAGVRFEIQVRVDKTLSNKEADLILLILENLAQNGIEATPPRRNVDVRVTDGSGLINFEVRDQGPGLAPHDVSGAAVYALHIGKERGRRNWPGHQQTACSIVWRKIDIGGKQRFRLRLSSKCSDPARE